VINRTSGGESYPDDTETLEVEIIHVNIAGLLIVFSGQRGGSATDVQWIV